MMWRLLFVIASLVCAGTTNAQDFTVERVATGLSEPLYVTAPPGDPSRVFILEQHTGRIEILELATLTLRATAFLAISGVSQGSEQGLLGMAFHPSYASNGFFYVSYTNPNKQIVRYTVSGNPDVANAASAMPVLSIAQPASNHNGGWIGFGPDGYLYVATGDGGGGNDTGTGHTSGTGNAQDITANLLGKLLRIDVNGDAFPADPARNYAIPSSNPFVGVTGDDEIWATGLRNPWRASFDRATGDLYLGDVGQSACEEIDVQPASSSGGENYGWRLREGTIATPTSGIGGPRPAGNVDPIMDYRSGCPTAGFGGYSVTGGYVYRGRSSELYGRYFFADYGTGDLWSLVWDGTIDASNGGANYTDLTDHSLDADFDPDVGTIASVSSFGEDAEGNVYVVDHADGEVFRVLPEPFALPAALLLLGLLSARRGRP